MGKNPSIEGNIYSDDYLTALNEQYPVGDVLGEYSEGISAGKYNCLIPFSGDTLGISEAEGHLDNLLWAAVRNEKWVGLDRNTPCTRGLLTRVTDSEYAHLVQIEDKNYLVPSEYFVKHCIERREEFSKLAL